MSRIEYEPKEGADYTTLEQRLHNAACDLCANRLECTEADCGIQVEITAMLFPDLIEEEIEVPALGQGEDRDREVPPTGEKGASAPPTEEGDRSVSPTNLEDGEPPARQSRSGGGEAII